jgi:hypothetical protein
MEARRLLTMKKGLILTVFILLLLGVSVVAADTSALPGGGWWVFFQIANVSGSEGTLTMQAFQEGDSTDYIGADYTISDGSALAYHPGLSPNYPTGDRIGFEPGLPDGFSGAAVISSDVELVAVAQVGNNSSGSVGVAGGTASAFYQGIGGEKVDTKVMFPTVKHNFNGQTTTFYVQAAGDDASVTITYKMNDGSEHTQTSNITANHMFIFDPANATPAVASTNCGSSDTSPCVGAATVESTTGSIAGVVVEHPHTGSPAAFVLSTRGFTTSDIDTKIIAPTIKNDFNGGTTGWSVQNAGDVQATVYVTFTVTNASNPALIGNQYVDQEVVDPGEATIFSPYRGNLGGMPAGTFAAGIASSSQPLVGSVNESKTMSGISGGKAKAVYACFGASSATNVAAAPMVKEMYNGKTTGVAVVNVGDQPAVIIATYTDSNGVAHQFQTTDSIQPGAAFSFYQAYNKAGLTGTRPDYNSKNSAIFTTNNGEPIVALAQESDPRDKALDIKNYEGFNQ